MDERHLPARRAQLSSAKQALLKQRLAGRGGVPQPAESSIPPRGEGVPAPLSYAQERLWQLSRLAPESAAYNMHLAYVLRGALDTGAFEGGLRHVVERHEILRSRISVDGDDPVQIPLPEAEFAFQVEEVAAADDLESQLAGWGDEEARRPFDLEKDTPLRVRVLRLGPERHLLLIAMHHVAADAWSWDCLLRELGEAYTARVRGRTAELPTLPIQYGDFAAWQRDRVPAARAQELETYWSRQFATEAEALRLPTDRPPSAAPRSYDGERERQILSTELTSAVKGLSSRCSASVFMTLLAAFEVLLHKYTGQEDLVVVSPVAYRHRAEIEHLIGYFNNLLALRSNLAGNPTFEELLAQIREISLGAFEHDEFPIDRLADLTDVSVPALSRLLFEVRSEAIVPLQLGDVESELVPAFSGTTTFDLSIQVEERDDAFHISASYRPELFARGTIESVLADYERVLEGICRAPETPLSELPGPTRSRPVVHDVPSETPPGERPRGRKRKPPKAEYVRERSNLAPQDALELRIAQIWEQLLKVPVSSVRDSFFELGGHSLLAVTLFGRLQKAFGCNVPMTALFEAPTIEKLAQIVRQGGWTSRWTSLIPIQPQGERTPFFFVPPLGGITVSISRLVKKLGADQPFYGLQAYGLDEGQVPNETVEAEAAHYIKEIRNVQPSGPYLIGGMCFGGTIAFEMAQQLHAAGERVALLATLDARPPSVTDIFLESPWDYARDIARARGLRQLKRRTIRLRNHLSVRAGRVLRRYFPFRKIPFLYTPQKRRHLNVIHAQRMARVHYRARQYPGDITVFDAEQRVESAQKRQRDLWQDLTGGTFTLEVILGNHRTMLDDGNIDVLAEKMTQALRGARE